MSQWVHNADEATNAISQWPLILGVCVGLTIFMAVIVSLRFYVRAIILRTIGSDDWVILFSAICSIIYSGLCIGQSRWGLGLPLGLRPKPNIDDYSIINFVGRPFYMVGITGFKVALCLSYLRILSQSNKIYQKVVWVVLITCVLSHLAGTLVLLFQCTPVRKSWIPATEGSCLPNDRTFYGLAAVTIFFDCIIFLLPIPILIKLQVNTRRKVGLIFVFMLGLFTTVCSILRMVQIITIAKTGNSTMLVLWGTIEMNVGIALTCIPTLTPLFTYFREKSSRYGNSDRRTGDQGNSLTVLKSAPRTRITESSSDRWKDHDSDDNSSQQGIIGLNSSLAEHHAGGHVGPGGRIMATTTVDVHVSDAKDGDQADLAKHSRWHPA